MFAQSSPSGEIGSLSIPLDSKRAHRLSKPRTITGSSSSLTLKSLGSETESDSPNSQKRTSGDKSNVVVPSPGGDCRSSRDSRQRIRAHLFGSSQESLHADSEEDTDNKKGFADTARGVRDRLSRTSTMVTRRASLRMSITPLNTSQSRLSLVPESSLHDFEDSERVFDQIKEKAFYDSLAAMNHVSSPVDEDMHVDAVASPIRRRSLFTPGLATRVPDDILRKPPPPQRIQSEADRDYYYNPNRPESSPLAKLAALGSVHQDRSSPVPRASTPSDMDYAHLGGLRPGTLRITNGNNSPIPRIRSPSTSVAAQLSQTAREEDYFSRAVPSLDHNKDDPKRVYDEDNYCQTEGEFSSDPLTLANRRLAEIEKFLRSAMPTTNSHPHRYTKDSLRQQAGGLLALDYERTSRDTFKRVGHLSLQSISPHDRTSSLALDYRSEIPDSPFLTTDVHQEKSLSSMFTSKRNEFEDQLFDDDTSAVSTTPDRRHEGNEDNSYFPQDTNRLLDVQDNDLHDVVSTQADWQSGSLSVTSQKSDDLGQVGEYLYSNSDTKADSGYDSSASSKSVRRKALPPRDRTSTLQPALKSSLKAPRNPSGPRDMPQRPLSVSPLPRPLLLTVPTSGIEASKSVLSSSETVPKSVWLTSTQSDVPSHPRKLRKSRPVSLPPPLSRITVQTCCEIDCDSIPPVSAAIAAKHAERLQNFPLLDHTFPSSRHTGIDSASSSPEVAFVPIRFPSPTKGLGDEETYSSDAKSTRRFSLTRGRRISFTRRNHTSSASEVNSRHDERPLSHDFSMADFGDVTAALGESPYDAARSSAAVYLNAAQTSRKPSVHYTLAAAPRVKVGMGEEQAAEFARLRSQYRSQSLSRLQLKSMQNTLNKASEDRRRPASMIMDMSSVPPMPALPLKSALLLRKSFNDRGGIPGKMPRPKSLNAPPVPPLPGMLQVPNKEQDLRSEISSTSQTTTYSTYSHPLSITSETQRAKIQGQSEESEGDPWVSQRQAWAERRRTATEGLQTANSSNTIAMSEPPSRRAPSPPGLHLAVPERRSHLPLTPPQSLPTSKRGSMISLKDHEMPSANRLSGRFDGGFSFLYEPGYGVGGSAGTRSMRTEASRKSVEVSRGYGIDLSDVPIFIAPSS
ncbi:hypothetical protein MMC34_006283 [Xylographa carneopallida]|nr:hypothetical protein [Xylographa carneopallida]